MQGQASTGSNQSRQAQKTHYQETYGHLKGHKDAGTNMNFDVENKKIEVRSVNINHLVKRFATNIFRSYDVDKRTGKYSSNYAGSTLSSSATGSANTPNYTTATSKASTILFGSMSTGNLSTCPGTAKGQVKLFCASPKTGKRKKSI